MPLVRIDVSSTIQQGDRRAIADVVYDALVAEAGAAENDRFRTRKM